MSGEIILNSDLKEPSWTEYVRLMMEISGRCCEHSTALSCFINAGNSLGGCCEYCLVNNNSYLSS